VLGDFKIFSFCRIFCSSDSQIPFPIISIFLIHNYTTCGTFGCVGAQKGKLREKMRNLTLEVAIWAVVSMSQPPLKTHAQYYTNTASREGVKLDNVS